MTELLSSTPTDIDHPDAELVTRATNLVPLIRQYAADGSEARRVAPEVMTALEEAGLFHLLVPKRLGGLGATFRTTVEAVAEVARGDGSTGWTTGLLASATGFTSTTSELAQKDVFGTNTRAKVCGIFSPASKSERVDGGYVISGRWPYASGSFAADWASLGIGLEGDDPRGMALVPAEAWTIEPTWFVAGMKGTGSDTLVVEEHFVPDHRIQRLKDRIESHYETVHKDELMASIAFNAVASAILVAPQIGLARHALEITRAKLPEKAVAYTRYSKAKLSPTHQIGVATAATKLHLAELLLARICLDIDQAAVEHRTLDLETRARLRNDTGVVAELSKEAIDALITANGAGSFAEANVMSRIWQDAEAAGRHALVTPEIGKEAYGRVLLGNDEPTIDL